MTKQALPREIFNTKNGLTYVLNGDYYIPLIEVQQDDGPIGKYGRMRMQYLKEHRPVLYNNMILTGKLHFHLAEVNECCTNMKLMLVAETAKQQGVTEELKARDQMAWVGMMNARIGKLESRIGSADADTFSYPKGHAGTACQEDEGRKAIL